MVQALNTALSNPSCNDMSTDRRIESAGSRAFRLAEALYFGSGDCKLFGWLHVPHVEAVAGIGLVICKPFGYEALCSHRSTRAFAEAAAALGVPTLRFDYLGTGDSADIDPHANQLEIWSRDVVAAIDELKRRTGVERVCLLGFRLGALIAVLAAAECKAVNALILIAPVISGRRYLREIRTTHLAAMLGADPAKSLAHVPSDIESADPGSMEVSGFPLSAATLRALAQVDISTATALSASNVLVIDGDSLPVSRGWATAISGLGAYVKYQALPGLIQMIITAPQFAKIPHEMITAVCDWLTPLIRGSLADQTKSFITQPSLLTLSDDSSAPRSRLTEQPVFFGAGAILFGIVTEPRADEKRRRAVILLNIGADHHIGASRLYVSLARRWAKRGYIALRMDLAGLGDSGNRPGRPDNEVFPPEALDDIRAGVDFLQSHYRVHDVTLVGLCSGAYHALRAAVAGVPVNRILMVNPQNYFWKDGMTLEDVQLAEVVRNPGLYQERLLSLAAWKKLLTGRANIMRIVKILIQRPLLALESHLRNVARALHIHLRNDLGWELERVVASGVRVVFIFARGEPGIDLLKLQIGSSMRRMGDHFRVHIFDSGDHVFSSSGPRSALEKILDEELFARSSWQGEPSGAKLPHRM